MQQEHSKYVGGELGIMLDIQTPDGYAKNWLSKNTTHSSLVLRKEIDSVYKNKITSP